MVSPHVVMGFEWSFMILAYIAVAARIYVRIGIKRDRIHWADGWLLAALVCAQGLLVCDTITFHRNELSEFANPSIPLMKIRFATNYLFDFGIYFPKFSIIALYHMIVPEIRTTMRMILMVLTFITVSSAIFTLFADTFWCGGNPSVNWVPNSCSAFNSMKLMRANWSLNFASEVLNLIYPFPLIADLKLSARREKFSLGLIFAMGFITLGVSIGRFVTMVYVENATAVYIWATTEFCTSVIIVAMIALRPLLKRFTGLMSSTWSGGGAVAVYRISTNDLCGNRRINRSDVETGTFWGDARDGPRSHVSSKHRRDASDSEVELNGMGSGRIIKTDELSISSEIIGAEEGQGSEQVKSSACL